MESDIKELIEGYADQAAEESWSEETWLKTIYETLDESSYKRKDYHPNVVIQTLYKYLASLNSCSRFQFSLTSQEKQEQKKQLKYLLGIPRNKAQKSTAWREWRHNHINASEAHKAIGNSNKTFIRDKSKPFEQSCDGSVATEHGNRFEPISVEIYKDKTGKDVYEFDSIEHPLYHFLAASPDGIDSDGIMIEIKNPLTRSIIGAPKPEYYTQTQIQMEVCGLNQCNFIECKIEEYPCLEDYIEDMSVDYKGIIIEYTNIDFKRIRHYSPFNISGEELEKWLDEIRLIAKDCQDINEVYWFLKQYSCFEVYRDKKWFEDIRPLLQNTWWEVLKYRESGNWESLAIKKRTPKVNPIDLAKPTPICLIDDEY